MMPRLALRLAAPRLRVRRSRRARARAAWSELQRELARARRFERPFALVRLESVDHGQERLARFEQELRDAVRRIDTAWGDRQHSYLLLPESDEAGVQGLLARLESERPELLRGKRCTWAIFPRDGLTVGRLLEESRGAAPGSRPGARSASAGAA